MIEITDAHSRNILRIGAHERSAFRSSRCERESMASPSAGYTSGGDWIGDEWTGVREALATVTSTEATSEAETQEAAQLAAELEEVRAHARKLTDEGITAFFSIFVSMCVSLLRARARGCIHLYVRMRRNMRYTSSCIGATDPANLSYIRACVSACTLSDMTCRVPRRVVYEGASQLADAG